MEMRVDDAGAGMVLTQDVVDERGNLLLEKGITLTRTYIARLKRLGVENICIFDPYAESLKQATVVSPALRTELRECFSTLFRMKSWDILNFKPPAAHMHRIGSAVDSVIDDAAGQLDQIVNVQVREPSADETQHAVNVCLLAVVTGLYLKFERSILRDLAFGALFHDLGKSMLPAGDQDKAFLHTIYGRELLLRSNVSAAVTRIAAEHHEAFDGTGHPKGLAAKDVHPLSRLVCIVNHFDNAISENERSGESRQEIIDGMMAGGNRLFDMNLLRAFLNTAALFPVGSLVRLNTGRTGYVVTNRAHFPLRPVVRVIEDYGHTDIDLVLKPNVVITELIAG
ncbi:HD-GYP domain-containing protein [Anaeroselena agilis]|uniref:HD domain-containing phosphohydrolase n=1 Tax=Anaeroselena agilis TaxID=3063788 RepID=A0ABU3P1R0_9FIRM|nr:HD domain-containing phosphohydrolase [Selenomonadales bacterium 4137-cl]